MVVSILILLFPIIGCEDAQFYPLSYDFINKLDHMDIYNKYATPTQFDGNPLLLEYKSLDMPTDVSISMYIEGISSFSAQTMDYHLDMYFQQVRAKVFTSYFAFRNG